jgi:hypothetical protein
VPAALQRGGGGAGLMAAGARLFPASPKPAGGPVTPALRAPRVRFARAAKDARFQKVITQLHQGTRKVAQHVPPKRKAAEAQAAAKAPPNEKEAGARANQVDEMKDAKVEKPQKGGFLAILRAEIEKVMPKNLDQADKFMKGGEAEQMKGAVGGNVSQQKEQAAGPTETATKAPPDTGKVEGKAVEPLPADPATARPPVAGAEAMPAPKPEVEVTKPAKDASVSADQKMKDAELNDQQLKKANDPRFSSVLTTRDKAKETAAAGPAKYRAGEQKALVQAKAGALSDTGKGVAGLVATKTSTSGKTKTRQQLAKEKDEAERKKVTDTIAGIFEKTKAKVEAKLSTLEADAMAIFDAGADAALARMKSSANEEIAKFKDDRYSGIIGKGRWLRDLFRDTPPEIKAIIARARARFTTEMDALAVRVASLVDARLAEAKAIVAAGQAEVKRYVAGLAPNLRSVGQKAEQDMAARFDELKNSIDEKANDLAEKLAQKYKDASEKADAAAKEMEEANKGALKALADKIGEIIKILAEFADRVVTLFKKAAGVVKKIIADPIGFLGNLLSAIKQGISRFVSNIWTHIKKGFMTWLFGELTKAGVEIPSDLTLPSILKLVLGVLGLTWANIRPKIVKKIGERAVSVLEKVVEILQKLFTSGPAALWEEMKAFVGNLKQMVIDAILDWVITKVITSAITKIATMFNPAGAIIQAIIMVYNVGAWLVNNISRILDFIESVVNSVDRIANGDVGGAAAWIEQALARMIPILIGFLASLIGLGGLAAKVKSFILKVQATVGKAVDFVIDKIFNFVKKIIGKVTGKGDKKSDADHAALGKAAAEEMKRPPPGGGDTEQLMKTKQTEAVQIAAKYSAKLTPPVRMKITVKPPKSGEDKVPFHVHIGPNDFDLDAAVEGEGTPPAVGLHGTLKKSSGKKKQESHHVPPKGLLNWLVEQAKKVPKAKHKEYPWIKQLAAVKKATYDPGDPLAAIAIHKETHIKTSAPDADKWRVHFGSETAKAVLQRLKGKKISVQVGTVTYQLDFVFIYKTAKLGAADKKQLQEMEAEAGTSLAAEAVAPAGVADRPVSTQFFKTELNAALEDAKTRWGSGVTEFKAALGAVARGAAAQAHAAVSAALQNSKKDGKKEERASALTQLKGLSKSTWDAVGGIVDLMLF